MPLPTDMDTALRGAVATVFTAVKIELPDRTLRLLDGSAELTVNGEAFVGEDADFGTLGAVEAVSEALGNEAPTLRLFLLPKTNQAMVEVAAPEAQGSPVTVWFGVVDPGTGVTVTGDPIFVGELDTAQVGVGDTRALTLDVASAWERLFETNEATRLTDAFWRTAYADDPSFEFTPFIPQEQPWGADRSRPVYSGGGGGVSNAGWDGQGGFVGLLRFAASR